MNTNIQTTDWYQELLEDLKILAISKIVELKHTIGKRILNDELKFQKPEYGDKRIDNLAKDLSIGASELWRCIQFAKKYPQLSSLDENVSWEYVKRKLLPEQRKEQEIPKLPEGKYNIIYADPAWDYFAGGYKNQSQHYDGMSLEEIANLPVQDISADDCILFLWVTFPILKDVFNIIEKWGFSYSTVGFTWVKSKKDGTGFAFGCGNWTRANSELCLIATKGTVKRLDASISQIIYEPKREHSRKPDIVRKKIIQLVGDLPRIELFARESKEGFEVWGNEIDKFNENTS